MSRTLDFGGQGLSGEQPSLYHLHTGPPQGNHCCAKLQESRCAWKAPGRPAPTAVESHSYYSTDNRQKPGNGRPLQGWGLGSALFTAVCPVPGTEWQASNDQIHHQMNECMHGIFSN